MAAEVRQTDTRDHSVMAKPAATTIDFDPQVVQEILGKIDGFDSDLIELHSSYMSNCRNIRESINNVFKEAKARGIPTKELRSLVKIRKNEASNVQIYNDLEPDQQQILSMLATAEGVKDLPLWRAASGLAPMEGAASANLQ
jgi:Uncharacterized protein conserved in bacteria (DUF2312)